MPQPGDTGGWAAPGVNFAGKGWRGTFRMRPTSLFDLAAKIHDLTFVLNDIEFSLGAPPQPSHSKKAKADAIFLIMTNFSRRIESGPDPAAFLYRNIASAIFDGDDPSVFRSNDGFRNPLVEPEVMAYLDDPKRSLTIPYSAIARRGRPTTDVPGPAPFGGPGVYSQPNYMQKVPMDDDPGFEAWFRETYAPVYSRIMEITGNAGSGGC